jgi:hypothetical protein
MAKTITQKTKGKAKKRSNDVLACKSQIRDEPKKGET